MDIQKLEQIKEKINRAKTERDKAQGAIEEIEKTWKSDFDCSNVNEAQELIKTQQNQLTKLQKKYDDLIVQIEEVVENVE